MIERLNISNEIGETQKLDLMKSLNRDFYLSFKFSQGKPRIQTLLFEGLGIFYKENLKSEDIDWITNSEEELQKNLAVQLAPKTHYVIHDMFKNPEARGPILDSEAETEFKAESLIFVGILGSTDRFDTGLDDEAVCLQTIIRDQAYQIRHRKYQAPDPHASYFREYILLQKPTGSEGFDSIFQSANDFVTNGEVSTDIRSGIKNLSEDWQSNHPGEQFIA